eukprot:scaffold3622_cov56-Isochrysis_galbana.AAC.1
MHLAHPGAATLAGADPPHAAGGHKAAPEHPIRSAPRPYRRGHRAGSEQGHAAAATGVDAPGAQVNRRSKERGSRCVGPN